MPTLLYFVKLALAQLSPAKLVERARAIVLALTGNLAIKKRTFDQHMASIFEKLGVSKSTGAVRVAVKWGLV